MSMSTTRSLNENLHSRMSFHFHMILSFFIFTLYDILFIVTLHAEHSFRYDAPSHALINDLVCLKHLFSCTCSHISFYCGACLTISYIVHMFDDHYLMLIFSHFLSTIFFSFHTFCWFIDVTCFISCVHSTAIIVLCIAKRDLLG